MICSCVRNLFAIVGLWALLRLTLGPLISLIFNGLPAVDATKKRFGKWVVITGPTDGIGFEVCRKLAKNGHSFFLISRSEDRLKSAADKLKDSLAPGAEIKTYAFDFSLKTWNADKFESMIKVIKNLGEIGILWNNVGVSYDVPKYVEELSSEQIENMISVNLRAAYLMTHALLSSMKEAKRGCVVFTGSGGGSVPADPMLSVYGGVKAGIHYFAESLKMECAGSGIAVQVHTPLFIVSKLSGFKRKSLFVLDTAAYAADAVAALRYANDSMWSRAAIIPSWPHCAQIWASWLPPDGIFNCILTNGYNKAKIRRVQRASKVD